MAQAVSYGSITIIDTNDIESITIEYARNKSTSTPPDKDTGGWSTTRPAWAQSYYIWQRARIHKSGTDSSDDTFGAAVCLTGSTGQSGAPGQSLTSTKTQYTNAASDATITKDNHTSYTWTDNIPEYNASKPAYWGRITNTYSNPSKTEYLFYKDNGITKAVAESIEANNNSLEAISISIDAQGNSQGALSIARATEQHYWFNPETEGTLEAGAYITDTPIDTFKNGKAGGYLLTRSDGLELGKGTNKFMTLSGSELDFYRPGTTTIDAKLSSTGLNITNGSIILGGHGATGINNGDIALSNSDFTRSINGTSRANLRFAIGKNFGVKNDGTVYASNADISGAITANSGKIGGWSIGTDTNKSLYYSNSTPGASTNNLVLSPSSVKNTNAIGGSAANLTWFISAGQAFGVTTAGKLYATGAEITGKINADTGRIGGSSGWTIASQQISSGSIGSDNSMYLSTKNLAGTVAGKELTTTTPSWRLTVGSNFGVDNTGKVYASGAEINGKITVSAGSNVYTTDSVNPLEIGGRNLLAFSELKQPLPVTWKGLTFSQEDNGWISVKGMADNTSAAVQALWENDSSTTKFGPGTYTLTIEDPDGLFTSGKLSIQVFWNGTAGAKYYVGPGKKTFTENVTSYIYRVYVYFDAGANGTAYNGRFRLKLERGNKATDWSPAPEDVAGNQNLLRPVPKSHNKANYMAYQLDLTENLKAGQTYTLQLWDVNVSHTGKTASELGTGVYWGGSSISLARWFGTSYFTNGHADRLTATFTVTASQASGSGASNPWLQIYNSPGSASGTMSFTIGRWKIEKGSTPTKWSISEEDAQKNIDTATAANATATTANNRATYHYGTCATAIGTAAKVVTLSGFALYTGAQITVKFTNGNTAAAPTLNVNDTGAKAVIVNGATSALTGKMDFPAGTTCSFTYDGSHWQLTGTDNIENVMEWTDSGGLKVKAKSGSKSMVNVTASAVDIYDKNGKLGNRVNDSGMTVYKGGSKRAEFFDSVNLYASDGSTKIASFAGDGVGLHSASLQNVGRFYVTSDTKDGKTRTFGTLSLGSSENPVIKGYNYTGSDEDISALIMDVNGAEWDSKFTASLDFTGMEFQQDNVGKWGAGLQSGGFYVTGPSGGLMGVDSSGNGTFAGGLSLGGNALADYVINRGTSGSWTYMKWASGTAMCYGTITGRVSKWDPWGSLYYGTMQYFNYPSGLFAAEPTLTAQAKMQSGASGDLFSVGFSNDGAAARTPTMYPTRPTSGLTGYIYYQLQAWGRWK